MFACQLDEVDGIARNTDRKLRVFLWVLHRIDQQFFIEYIHIQVLAAIGREIAVQQAHQVVHLDIAFLTQRSR